MNLLTNPSLHPKCVLEMGIKLELYNCLYWDVWLEHSDNTNLLKSWCNKEVEDLDNTSPLEYFYRKIIKSELSESDAKMEIKSYLKKMLKD